ncbi:MAG: tRNA pseudouridine(13) synthase TruD [Deltaproteobacteria bacterium]|nr:tRNA pseudouridine(13) synthase TruD [Deltaproteobacteria bacterium]
MGVGQKSPSEDPTPHATGPLPCVLKYLQPGFSGTGGRIKSAPQDFIVEEMPLYQPVGSGEHLYLFIEKTGLSTEGVAEHLGRALGIRSRDIGFAGRKDSEAVSRQWFSAHLPEDPDENRLQTDRIRVLRLSRHANKLRPGHLSGNRFEITIRGAARPADFQTALEKLHNAGFPNYFGGQRLGVANHNALQGRRIISQAREGHTPRGNMGRNRFFVNAYQSDLFNRVLALRLGRLESLETMLSGDLAVLHRNGAFFPVSPEELDECRARAASGEISPSGPLFGYKTPLAGGIAGDMETQVLQQEGLSVDDFRFGGKRHAAKGERRALRAFARDIRHQWLPEGDKFLLMMEFTLAKGVFATSMLREIMKNDDFTGLAEEHPD